MACGPEATIGQREAAHARSRRNRPRTAPASLGQGRTKLRFRRAEREGDARGPFRRQEPADYLPLHVRPGVERRLPELLVQHGPHGRRARASGATRRVLCGDLTSTIPQDCPVQKTHGLGVQLGVFQRQRFQPRLSRGVHQGRTRQGRGGLQLWHEQISERGSSWNQRLLQGRERRYLSHLFRLRPRDRKRGQYTKLYRPGAEGEGRRWFVFSHGLGTPPRPLRRRPTGGCRQAVLACKGLIHTLNVREGLKSTSTMAYAEQSLFTQEGI